MSTKFYIHDDNGRILSTDGKTRYTLLEGKAAYDFLKTEEGRKRCFHIEMDENGDKLGIEVPFDNKEKVKEYEAEQRRSRYLRDIEVECKVTFVSGNTQVEELDHGELFDTIEDESADVFDALYAKEEIVILHKAIASLNAEERDLLDKLFFSHNILTEYEYANLYGISQQAVHKRKSAIFKKIKNYF